MKFRFLNFVLDTSKQTLFHNTEEIELTKKIYLVLKHFVDHSGQVVTKDQIINDVWQGRLVTENSIDQSISKIRRLLAQFEKTTIIKTAYGKGFEFVPDVHAINDEQQQTKSAGSNRFIMYSVAAVIFVALFSATKYLPDLIDDSQAKELTPVLLVQKENKDDWLNNSGLALFDSLFSTVGENNVLDYASKPKQLSQQEYIDNYLRINPKIEVIETQLAVTDQLFTFEIFINKNSVKISEKFTGNNLQLILLEASEWISENSSLHSQKDKLAAMLPSDSHVLELYMRGLHSLKQGEFDQAENYAELAIEQQKNFHLARLLLADIKYSTGDNAVALSLLDTLSQINTLAVLDLPIAALRAEILDTEGRHEEVVTLLQPLISQYELQQNAQLLQIRYNLSYSLTSLNRYDEALQQLRSIKEQIAASSNPEMLAHTLQKQGSILLQIGKAKEAKEAANRSLQLFTDLTDLMSAGKTNILLARIANHESDYKQSIHYLEETISIYRNAEYALGVGASLNELIYALMVNGQFTKAWSHMLEMKQIALDIDYFAMLMAAKQFEFDISRRREQWVLAEQSMADYLRMSEENDFARGLFKYQLFALDLALDRAQADRALPFIESIQAHIESTGEQRLQPRLNTQKARLYFLNGEKQKALNLLMDSRELALENSDKETLSDIDNLMLEQYLLEQDYSRAEQVLKTTDQSKHIAYPFLLYKSKVLLGLGQRIKAIEAAQLCKAQANDFWRPQDELYLTSLLSE